jgi:elongation factor Ts
MSTISASLVKELREKTGVGMMDCKKALEETSGNIEQAINTLREKGLSKAAKKSDRSTKEGRIITYISSNNAVILELNCETDFVANNNNFRTLGKTIAEAISTETPETVEQVKSLSINGSTIEQLVSDAILQLGENIVVGQFKQLSANNNFSEYEHTNGKIGVLVEFSESIDTDLGKGVAMHVAAMNPLYLSSDQVPSKDIENEANVLRNQAISEGKPEQVVDKIVQGRIQKFYKENCLVEQSFVKDQDKQIKDILPSNITIKAFHRLSLVG